MPPIDNSRPPTDLTHEDVEALRHEIEAEAHEDAEKLPENFGPGIPTVQEAMAAQEALHLQGAEVDPDPDQGDSPASPSLDEIVPESEDDRLIREMGEIKAETEAEARDLATDAEIEHKLYPELPPDLSYDQEHQGDPPLPDGPTDQPITPAPEDKGDE